MEMSFLPFRLNLPGYDGRSLTEQVAFVIWMQVAQLVGSAQHATEILQVLGSSALEKVNQWMFLVSEMLSAERLAQSSSASLVQNVSDNYSDLIRWTARQLSLVPAEVQNAWAIVANIALVYITIRFAVPSVLSIPTILYGRIKRNIAPIQNAVIELFVVAILPPADLIFTIGYKNISPAASPLLRKVSVALLLPLWACAFFLFMGLYAATTMLGFLARCFRRSTDPVWRPIDPERGIGMHDLGMGSEESVTSKSYKDQRDSESYLDTQRKAFEQQGTEWQQQYASEREQLLQERNELAQQTAALAAQRAELDIQKSAQDKEEEEQVDAWKRISSSQRLLDMEKRKLDKEAASQRKSASDLKRDRETLACDRAAFEKASTEARTHISNIQTKLQRQQDLFAQLRAARLGVTVAPATTTASQAANHLPKPAPKVQQSSLPPARSPGKLTGGRMNGIFTSSAGNFRAGGVRSPPTSVKQMGAPVPVPVQNQM